MRLIDADALMVRMYHDAFEVDSDFQKWESGCWIRYKMFENAIEDAPVIDAVSVVRCKDCKYRPVKEDVDGENYGFNIVTPERSSLCPCIVEDGWYSWMPEDNFFCGYGEREDEQ